MTKGGPTANWGELTSGQVAGVEHVCNTAAEPPDVDCWTSTRVQQPVRHTETLQHYQEIFNTHNKKFKSKTQDVDAYTIKILNSKICS